MIPFYIVNSDRTPGARQKCQTDYCNNLSDFILVCYLHNCHSHVCRHHLDNPLKPCRYCTENQCPMVLSYSEGDILYYRGRERRLCIHKPIPEDWYGKVNPPPKPGIDDYPNFHVTVSDISNPDAIKEAVRACYEDMVVLATRRIIGYHAPSEILCEPLDGKWAMVVDTDPMSLIVHPELIALDDHIIEFVLASELAGKLHRCHTTLFAAKMDSILKSEPMFRGLDVNEVKADLAKARFRIWPECNIGF